MTAPDFWRQLDLVTPDDLRVPVTIVGAGGIGSPTTLALAKMGCSRITVYDPDVVEPHNLPNQLYLLEHVGLPKVVALQRLVHAFTGVGIHAVQERVAEQRLQGIVISGVDSMASREAIWRGAVRYRPSVELYIDARMGAEVCRVYTVRPTDPDDVRAYEPTLYADEQAVEEACTATAIIYNVFSIAGLIGSQVKKHVKGQPLPREIVFDLVTLTLMVDGCAAA